MAKSNNQKGKILYLARLLNGTGEGQVATMQDILAYLQENGINAERKSIYDDMDVLRSFGMDIRYRRGRPGGYYLEKGQLLFLQAPENRDEKNVTDVRTVPDPGTRVSAEPVAVTSTEPASESMAGPVPADHAGRYWADLQEASESQEGRDVKLIILDQGGKKEVEAVFGQTAKIRDRQDGTWMATVSVPDSRRFYGWLTAVGMSVRLSKPRKMIQNYREYLKYLSREYKQVP